MEVDRNIVFLISLTEDSDIDSRLIYIERLVLHTIYLKTMLFQGKMWKKSNH